MTIAEIQLKADQLASRFAKIKSDKNNWRLRAKPLLVSILTNVKGVSDFNLTIDDSMDEVVELSIEIDENEPIAALSFVLTYDGHIAVRITSYTIDYSFGPYTKSTNYKQPTIIEIASINEAMIYESVDMLFSEMFERYIMKPSSPNADELGNESDNTPDDDTPFLPDHIFIP